MATALYRRYRPETFSEMIGQAHVTEPLMTALRAGRIGHAYLFSGPRGCGKTTSARILARCLNCVEGPTDHPCGTCESCIELSRDGGGSLDVVEIDAASHGGVDDARDLRERAVFAPARDRYKIFIIDEAHMVTPGGFNALLKIVEEPPPHVKFIFATTEPEKVIGTIRSRTHHYPFRLIAPGLLIDYVQQLSDSEGVEIEPGVLPLVVRSGGGSVRDTLSILDQLIAGSEGAHVSLERATGLLGFTSSEMIDEVANALSEGDAAAAFTAADRVVQTGQDPRRFVEDLLERLRDLIVISATSVQGASAVFRGVPEDQLQRMFEQAQRFRPGQLSRLADTVSETLDVMSGATAPRLHLELMVARALLVTAPAAAGDAAVAAAAQPARVSHPVSAPATSQPAAAPSAPQPSAPQPSALQPSAPQPNSTSPAAAPAPAPVALPTPSPASASASAPAAASTPGGSASADPAAVDVIATMRSAREFLRGNDSSEKRAPIVPLGGHPTAQSAHQEDEARPTPREDAAPPAASQEQVSQSQSTTHVPDGDVNFESLQEVWPEILHELLESDRDAWNAVQNVQPLDLQDGVFSVGFNSQSDLDAFKMHGAGPLREALLGAFGIQVKYKPQRARSADAPRQMARREGESAPQEPSPRAPALDEFSKQQSSQQPSSPEYDEPPIPDGYVPRESDFDAEAESYPEPDPYYEPTSAPVESSVHEVASIPTPTIAPTAAQAPTPIAAPTPAPTPTPTPAPTAAPTAAPAPAESELRPAHASALESHAEPKSEPHLDPRPTPELQQEREPEPRVSRVKTPEPPSASEPEPETSKKKESPGFTRYGEAVVREVFGARFLEQRPLPEGFEK